MFMDRFLSCDWGTSSFRLRLVDKATVVDEVKSDKGNASIFEEWKKEQHSERLSFYQAYLAQQIKNLEDKSGSSLRHIPVVLSGMASSTIGMIELPYKHLPFKIDGSDLERKTIKATASFPHQLIIISGARTDIDVLRGEETLLAGCSTLDSKGKGVFIFPGTHSKHLFVENDLVKDFKTYLTGELFHLLSTKSILSNSIEKNEFVESKFSNIFSEAVNKGATLNILNAAFHTRTNQLFGAKNKEENYHYLSGLLIGAELKELVEQDIDLITLVCSREMQGPYTKALEVLHLDKHLAYKNDSEALIEGQLKILEGQISAS
jgi:2-dehydro-3-deoxygalactonokinase